MTEREKFTVDAPKDVTYERTDEGILIHGDDLGTPYEGQEGVVLPPGVLRPATMQEVFGEIPLQPAYWNYTPEGYLDLDLDADTASDNRYAPSNPGEILFEGHELEPGRTSLTLGMVFSIDSAGFAAGSGFPGLGFGLRSNSNNSRIHTQVYVTDAGGVQSGALFKVDYDPDPDVTSAPGGVIEDGYADHWLLAETKIELRNFSGPNAVISHSISKLGPSSGPIEIHPDDTDPLNVLLFDDVTTWADVAGFCELMTDAGFYIWTKGEAGRCPHVKIAYVYVK